MKNPENMKTLAKPNSFLTTLFAIAALGPWAGLMAQSAATEIAGKVGDAEVTVEEIRSSLESLASNEREALRADPAALNQYVRSLLVQKLLLREAKAKGWEKNPVVTERLERLREGVVTSTFLESEGKIPDGYPTEAELAAAYEANKPALLVPKTWKLAQIFIADSASAAEKTKAEAKLDTVVKALAAPGADFAALARAHSEDTATSGAGGEIGWLAETQLQAAIREQLPSLDLNQISKPIRLDDGWHVIKVLDIREAHTPPLAQIRDVLAGRLREEKARTTAREYLAGLLRDNPIAINELVLAKALPGPLGEKEK